MGQGGCTSLCSAVNSCTPLQGLITQVSLEIPATKTPGGKGAGGKKSCAMCAMSVLCSSANHHLQEHFYWKEFISQLNQRCPSLYFPVWGDFWGLTEMVASTQGKIMLQTSGCLQRYTGDSFHEFPFVCILLPSVILSWLLHLFFIKQHVCPNWTIPNVSCLYKTIEVHNAFPLFLLPLLNAHYNMDM